MLYPVNQQSGTWGPQDRPSGMESEINQLTAKIEKEQGDLSEMGKEIAKHIAAGDGDTAQIKSALLQQKQMEIQMMQMQIQKLDDPGFTASNEISAGNGPEVHPAAVLELSPYAQNLIRHEDV